MTPASTIERAATEAVAARPALPSLAQRRELRQAAAVQAAWLADLR